jgi:hypothetical protein
MMDASPWEVAFWATVAFVIVGLDIWSIWRNK